MNMRKAIVALAVLASAAPAQTAGNPLGDWGGAVNRLLTPGAYKPPNLPPGYTFDPETRTVRGPQGTYRLPPEQSTPWPPQSPSRQRRRFGR
jgi:hypothetical protein